MRFQSQTFWLAKDADSPDQYQDAFGLDAERGLAAIADGVSSAIFSGPWARILTRATIDDPPRFDVPGEFQDWLARRRADWAGEIDTTKLTWYQRPKMVDGAMTTLLWCELWPDETGDDGLAKNYQLYSFAIGDSCLFHVREDKCLAWYPLAGSAEFGLNPAVVHSIDRKRDHLLEFRCYDERCLPGDLLVLATDAIALWAVECQEAGDPIGWERYWGMSDEAWRDEIFALRSESRMRFDDSTLVLLRIIEETPAPPPPAPWDGLPRPSVAEDGLGRPSVAEDGLGRPSVAEDGLGRPSVAEDGLGRPSVAEDGLGRPSVAEDGLGRPSVAEDGLGRPSVAEDGLGRPSVAEDGLGRPSVAEDGLGRPSVAEDGLGRPSVAEDGLGRPSHEEPLTVPDALATQNNDVLVLPEDALVSVDGEPAPTLDLDPTVVDLAAPLRDIDTSPLEPPSSVTDEFAERDEAESQASGGRKPPGDESQASGGRKPPGDTARGVDDAKG